jgi:hypothetical protein
LFEAVAVADDTILPSMIDEPEGAAGEQAPADDQASDPNDQPSVTRRVVAGASDVVTGAGEAIAGAGEVIVEALRPAAEKVRDVAADLVEDLAEAREVRRRKRQRRRLRTLPNLFDVHPESRGAPTQEVGLIAVPVDEIVGSAVDGPAQRGPDFLPLKPLRSLNWESRWQRIRKAIDQLQVLPPIEVLQTPDGYWVVDGHNRVAAAKAIGQVAIDAAVRAVRLPGQPLPRSRAELAPLLEGSGELRAAGRGELTPGATRESVRHDHASRGSGDGGETAATDPE